MEKYFEKMPHMHSCVAGLYFHGGSLIESEDVRGISHFLEHLIFRNLDSMSMRELYRRLNKLGVTLHGFTNQQMIGFYAQSSPEKVDFVVEILFRILNEFHFTECNVEAEKRVVLRQIEEKTEYYFDKKVKEKYYRDTPFSGTIMGKREDVEKFNIDAVNRYKDKLFREKNAAFILTGNFSDRIKRNVCNRAEELLLRGEKRVLDLGEIVNLPRHFENRSEEDDLLINCRNGICDVCISFDVSKKYNPFAVDLLIDILAKGDGSKLSWIMKDCMGWVGDVWGEIERFKAFSRMKIEFSIDGKNLVDSLEEFIKIIRNLKAELSEEELREVIEFYTFFPHLEDDPIAYNYHIAENAFVQGNLKYKAEDLAEEYRKITSGELRQLACVILVPENLSVSVGYDNRVVRQSVLKKKLREIRRSIRSKTCYMN